MRRSLRVSVPRVAVMDGTGQRVQLLQWYPKSHPHVGGNQVPAGHAKKKTRKLDNKLHKLTLLLCLDTITPELVITGNQKLIVVLLVVVVLKIAGQNFKLYK